MVRMDRIWHCGTHRIACGARTLLVGVVNVTPDSFSDGGLHLDPEAAVTHGLRLATEGADVLDVGGESTRPGAEPVATGDEIARVVPVIAALSDALPDVPVSVDTRKPEVAAAGIEAGASIVNDVAAGAEPGMLETVATSGAGMVLMHMKGEPRTMQVDPTYVDVVREVASFLDDRCDAAVATGIARDRLCVDPGIGFGKDLGHNLELLRATSRLREELELPLLMGPSRKGFIGTLTGVADPADRLEGTAGAVAWCAAQGADLVRVHDVGAMRRVVQVVDAIARGGDAS
jgi:dihydropteroate synthase